MITSDFNLDFSNLLRTNLLFLILKAKFCGSWPASVVSEFLPIWVQTCYKKLN